MEFFNVFKENMYVFFFSVRFWLKNCLFNIILKNINYSDMDVESINDSLEN